MALDDKFLAVGDGEDTSDESISFLNPVDSISRDDSVRRPSSDKVRRMLRLVGIYALLLCFALPLYEVLRRYSVSPNDSKTGNLLPGRNSIPSFEQNKIVRFEPNPRFTGNGSFRAWRDLKPKGGGWITIERGEELGLGPPLRYNHRQAYGISVFHQLHCVAAIHHAYSKLCDGRGAKVDPFDQVHIEHCFDYVRQALMCNADLSLEHRREPESTPPGHDTIDGWGVLHQCRDWDAVVQFVEQDRRAKERATEKGQSSNRD